jgi:hypothetical protein
MYGLVNRGIRDLVMKHGGEALWQTVRQNAGIDVEDFLSMQAYDDGVTLALVAHGSKALGMSAEGVLREFGRHWVLFTGQEGYGPMMDVSGNTLEEFLNNLDQMHAQIALSMPELDPPGFSCQRTSANTIRIEYFSNRSGLAPMVEGLLEGLMLRFNEKGVVRFVQGRETQDAADVFEVCLEVAQEVA